jgi:DNA-binding response OmpR family regulator
MKGELLLVEDSHNTQVIVKKILELQGYILETASDGLTGFRKIEEFTPKVVLLDISLPEMDGMEVARRVRAHENEDVRETVLIALTAMASVGDRERFFDVGCDDYLPKPFRSAQLVEVVEKYMSADYIPGVSINPGMLRRKKVAEMEAYQAEIAEKQAATEKEEAEKSLAREELPKSMPTPKKKPTASSSVKADKHITFEVGDDFLSDLLDPGIVEPVDPVLDDE